MLKLHINGVQTLHSLFRFNSSFHYSTSAKTLRTSNFANYLVDSLGFTKEEASLTSLKVSSFRSSEKPNSVIDFFNNIGFSQTQIKTLVARVPKILSCNVDTTLRPKIQAFQQVGFSGDDIAHILTTNSDICWRSLDDHIIPTLELLKSVFSNHDDSNESLITAVKNSTWLLGPGARKGLADVISLLQSYGLSPAQIKTFSVKKSRYMSLGPKVLESILIRVEKLGIPRGTPMFYHGICAVGSLSEANLVFRMGIYKSYGFTDDDMLVLARKNPYALLISDPRLRKGLDFFMKVVGYQPSQIASVPYVLTYSLEKRVLPRYRVWKGLKEMDLQKGTKSPAFVTCLTKSEPLFFEKFVLPFKDEYPTIYRDYMKVARPVLKAAK